MFFSNHPLELYLERFFFDNLASPICISFFLIFFILRTFYVLFRKNLSKLRPSFWRGLILRVKGYIYSGFLKGQNG